MLNGVGGRTVFEAKERLTYAEAMDWFAFIRKRGSINQGMRMEGLIAQLSMVLCAAHGLKKKGGGDFTMADFMQHAEQPGLTIEDFTKVLGGSR